jgi:hypothetical protein
MDFWRVVRQSDVRVNPLQIERFEVKFVQV